MPPDEAQPEFFIDRSLGKKHLATALRELGLTVHTMASAYGEARAQELSDEVWLADAEVGTGSSRSRTMRYAAVRPSATP